jgi:hypothetical protein
VRGLQACAGTAGAWKEAATAYSKLFAMEALVTPGTDKRFDPNKRQLVPAYVEWGVAEAMAGNEGHDKDRLSRAADIFERSLAANNLVAGDELWWRAKTWQVQTMVWRGQYDTADIALRDLERTTQDYDGNKYGAKTKLLALKAEVGKKK